MHLPTILTALLLPLAVVADGVSTTTTSSVITMTSTCTLTKTVTLQRPSVTSVSNSTFIPYPTAGSTTFSPSASTTGPGTAISPRPNNSGSALGAAHVAAAAVAGVFVAALL